MIASISNWLTNRRIVWIAAAIAFLGFTGPGLFGLSPPKFFHGHDAVTEKAKLDVLPSGIYLAPVIAPNVAPPTGQPTTKGEATGCARFRPDGRRGRRQADAGCTAVSQPNGRPRAPPNRFGFRRTSRKRAQGINSL